MLSSLFTKFEGDAITINRVKFEYNNHALTYNGMPVAATFSNADGLHKVVFLNIPELKRTIKIIDYHHLENVYKFPKPTISIFTDQRKKPFYYDLSFYIYFSPHTFDEISESFDVLFKQLAIIPTTHVRGYYIKYKGEEIRINIFVADDDTGNIIELEYTDRNYPIFHEFEHFMKESIPDLS